MIKDTVKKLTIEVCEWIITKLDPIRVKTARMTTGDVSVRIAGYLRPGKWTDVHITISAWMKPTSPAEKEGIADVRCTIGGQIKKRKLINMPMREGHGVTV